MNSFISPYEPITEIELSLDEIKHLMILLVGGTMGELNHAAMLPHGRLWEVT